MIPWISKNTRRIELDICPNSMDGPAGPNRAGFDTCSAAAHEAKISTSAGGAGWIWIAAQSGPRLPAGLLQEALVQLAPHGVEAGKRIHADIRQVGMLDVIVLVVAVDDLDSASPQPGD